MLKRLTLGSIIVALLPVTIPVLLAIVLVLAIVVYPFATYLWFGVFGYLIYRLVR